MDSRTIIIVGLAIFFAGAMAMDINEKSGHKGHLSEKNTITGTRAR